MGDWAEEEKEKEVRWSFRQSRKKNDRGVVARSSLELLFCFEKKKPQRAPTLLSFHAEAPTVPRCRVWRVCSRGRRQERRRSETLEREQRKRKAARNGKKLGRRRRVLPSERVNGASELLSSSSRRFKKKATALKARATVSTHSSPFTELEVDAERGDEQWGVMWGRKRASKREERRERARER